MARSTATDGPSHDSRRARVTPAMIDRTRPVPERATARHAASPSAGLDGHHRTRRRRNVLPDTDAGELGAQLLAPGSHRLADDEIVGAPP